MLLGIFIKYEYDNVKANHEPMAKDYVFLGNETTNDTIDVGKSIDGYEDSLVVDPFGIYNNPSKLSFVILSFRNFKSIRDKSRYL